MTTRTTNWKAVLHAMQWAALAILAAALMAALPSLLVRAMIGIEGL